MDDFGVEFCLSSEFGIFRMDGVCVGSEALDISIGQFAEGDPQGLYAGKDACDGGEG
jgi:hypothetical protein